MARHTSIFVCLVSTSIAACARYEWKNELDVPGACPPAAPAPEPPPALVGGPGGRVTGRVLSATSEAPVVGAQVVVVWPLPPRGVLTDSAGRFALESLPPGDYAVRARSVGYVAHEQRIVVQSDSGPALDFRLGPVIFDGPCSGFAAMRVRKPWWKW